MFKIETLLHIGDFKADSGSKHQISKFEISKSFSSANNSF